MDSQTIAGHRPYGAPPDGYTGPRRSLLLAGGGMRVAYQAGVMRALLDAGLVFAHADGASGGTINLAMLLSGLSPDEMCARWRTLQAHDFASFMPLQSYLKAADAPALGTASGVRDKVFPHLGIDIAAINRAQGIVGTFNVCNFTRKTCEVAPHDTLDLDLLVAGISLPIFMPPVPRGGCLYLDAVWIKDANPLEAVRRGAEEIWLVWCIGNSAEYKNGVFNQYVHMIELSANGKLFDDLERIDEINRRIAMGDSPYGQTRPITLHVVKPEYPLPLDPDYYVGRIDAATLIDMGYADAARYLAGMRPEGLPFTPEVTQMKDPGTGITFRETMSGGFALDETDPAAGAAKGTAAGATLTIHCAIAIRDVDRFIADPAHMGEITGRVSFPPFGQDIPAKGGTFNLFSPTDDPRCKLMVYELAFAHDGQEYYLAGRKEVRTDLISDLWRDTTTLYTQLHRGTDHTGPIIGAGILRLDAAEFAHLLAGLHTTHAESIGERATAVLRFGRFFAGELWDTYGAHVIG